MVTVQGSSESALLLLLPAADTVTSLLFLWPGLMVAREAVTYRALTPHLLPPGGP